MIMNGQVVDGYQERSMGNAGAPGEGGPDLASDWRGFDFTEAENTDLDVDFCDNPPEDRTTG